MAWRVLKKIPDVQLYLGLAIMLGFSVFAVHTADNSASKAHSAANEAHSDAARAQKTADNVGTLVCEVAVPSWEIRQQLILDTNEPSKLASGIDPQSPQGMSLQRQIDATNVRKAERQQRDLILNGPKPCQ